jgi:hypothetical protein
MSLCLLILLYGPKTDGSNNPSPQAAPGPFAVPPLAARCTSSEACPGEAWPPFPLREGGRGVRSHPPLPLTLGDNAHPQGFHLLQHAAKARVGL